MDLHEIGTYLHEHAGNRLVDMTLRLLGFTALALDVLLDEVSGSATSDARWGLVSIEDDSSTGTQ